jgi:hypothetical protein
MKILRREQFTERTRSGRLSDGSDVAETTQQMDRIDVINREGARVSLVLPIGATDQQILDAAGTGVELQLTNKTDLEVVADRKIQVWVNRKAFRVEMEARTETQARIDKMKELEDAAYTKARQALVTWITA